MVRVVGRDKEIKRSSDMPILIIMFALCALPGSFDLDDYKWERRVLLIFAPGDSHPEYVQQRNELTGNREGMEERDMLIVYVLRDGDSRLQLAPNKRINEEKLRNRFDLSEDDFAAVLVGKDGTEKLRSEDAISIQRIFNRIDSMPMRQREMRQGGGN